MHAFNNSTRPNLGFRHAADASGALVIHILVLTVSGRLTKKVTNALGFECNANSTISRSRFSSTWQSG